MKREEILDWFKRYFIDLWKGHDLEAEDWEDWRPTRSQQITEDMDTIAKRCRGTGEQNMFRYCKRVADDLLERAEEWDESHEIRKWSNKWNLWGRGFPKNWMWDLKREWIRLCIEEFSMEKYEWRAVKVPQIERMRNKLKTRPGWDEDVADEWYAECIARGIWQDPEKTLPRLKRQLKEQEEYFERLYRERDAKRFADASTEEISDPEEEEERKARPKGWLYRRKR